MVYVVGKLISRSRIKGYNVLLTGDKKIQEDDVDETEVKGGSELKLFNKTAYNELILSQEDTAFFHIFEEAKKKDNKLLKRYNRKRRFCKA